MNDTPPPAPSPAPKNKMLLLFGGVLAVVLVAGVLIGVLSSSAGPASVTESFFEAARDGDTAKVESLVCADHQLGDLLISKDVGELSWKVSGEQVNGDTARVPVSITISKDGDSITEAGVAELRKQDGEWKLCDLADKD